MNPYFSNFQQILYNEKLMIDITQRAAILNSVFGNRYAFYPYEVKNGMRADLVAEKYYGDANLVWLVYFSNNIVDPYYEWPLSETDLNKFITKKYGSLSDARNKVISYRVNWYENNDAITVAQYNTLDPSLKKYWTANYSNYNSPVSYSRRRVDYNAVAMDENGEVTLAVPSIEQQYWSPVTAYDEEIEINRSKSHIKLLDNRLSSTAITNLKDLLRV